MFIFNKKYFQFFILLFITEVYIALYVNDKFIRPYLGDVLVVILIYCFIKSFIKIKPLTAAITTLLLAYTIEFAQYFNIVERLNLSHSKLARTVIGIGFDKMDLVCYAAGIIITLLIEKFTTKKELS